MRLLEWAKTGRCKYCSRQLMRRLITSDGTFRRTKFVTVCEKCDKLTGGGRYERVPV